MTNGPEETKLINFPQSESCGRILPIAYTPGAGICIDEQFVAFRGNCPFRQYIPSKPAKYRIKFWMAATSNNDYVYKIQPYLGKQNDQREIKQGKRVALELSEGLKGRNITTDNFFTSYEAAQELRKRGQTMVGTLRKNKKVPNKLAHTKERVVHSSLFAHTKDTMLVSYCPRKYKTVFLLSTMHISPDVSDRDDKKPEVILFYNFEKGKVDKYNQCLSTYTTAMRTKRWPNSIF